MWWCFIASAFIVMFQEIDTNEKAKSARRSRSVETEKFKRPQSKTLFITSRFSFVHFLLNVKKVKFVSLHVKLGSVIHESFNLVIVWPNSNHSDRYVTI